MTTTFVRASLWAAALVMIGSSSAAAQTPSPGAGPRLVTWNSGWEPASFGPAILAATRSRAPGRGAKWAIGGALILGTLSAAVANALCERRECIGPTITWGLIGAGVGAALGALIASATDE